MAYCTYSRNTINVTGFNYNFTSLAKLRNCFLGKYLFYINMRFMILTSIMHLRLEKL